VIIPLTAVTIVTGWIGCSVEEHYETLSFFFDGVPQPAALSDRRTLGGAGGPGALQIVSSHSAFTDRRCAECHGGTGDFGFVVSGFERIDAGVCANCHSDVLQQFPVIHGPVAAGECLWCHQPHESPYADLLNLPSPRLCLDCHTPGTFSATEPPEHADLERDCLECHHGHGGADWTLLRPPPVEETPEVTPEQTTENEIDAASGG
jgi:predicted CXXCH cytochrome family protein